VMNYLVVPLSEIGRIPQFTWWTLGGNILAMLGFGLLIAFFARGSLAGQAV
jgi:glycopeptide antibiotics resistance protein